MQGHTGLPHCLLSCTSDVTSEDTPPQAKLGIVSGTGLDWNKTVEVCAFCGE